MILGMALLLENTKALEKLLTFIGADTIVIFAVQKPIISIFAKCFEYVKFPGMIALIVTCIGTIIGACVICLFVNLLSSCTVFEGEVCKMKEIKQS